MLYDPEALVSTAAALSGRFSARDRGFGLGIVLFDLKLNFVTVLCIVPIRVAQCLALLIHPNIACLKDQRNL